VRELFSRLKGFALGRRHEMQLDDEVEFHLAMLAEDYARRGMTPEDARTAARRTFGGVTQVKEAYRDQRGLPAIDTFVQDARYALRTLRRTPGFTVAALLTLALGIGANTAIFSVVHAVVLRPLPFADPDRLVVFGDSNADGLPGNIGYTTLHDYRERASTLDNVVAVRSWFPTLVANGEAERINAMRVSWDYFQMLGVRPALGRGFTRDEDRPDHWRVLMISDGLWRRRFNADPGVIDRTLRMNDRDYRIVGVLPASYEPLISDHFYERADVWAPLGYDTAGDSSCRSCQHLKALGRMRADSTLDAARAELDAIRTELARSYPSDYAKSDVAVVRLQAKLAGPVRGGLLALLVAVGIVLLIACANVANLLLARSMHRSREMAVRAALGAGRGRLVRQLLTESLILGMTGGLLGIGLAAVSLQTLLAMAPVSIPRLDQVAVDGRVLTFALGLSVLTGIIFGLVPSWRTASVDPQRALGAESRSSVGAASNRTRRLLVISDLALALVLLAAAGLMLKSVGRLMQVDAGFDPRNVLTLQFSLVGQAYAEDSAVNQFIDRVVERVRALPGVEAAAATGQIPMGGNYDQRAFSIEGRVPANASDAASVERYSVTADYFKALRIPLIRGRLLTDSDRADSMPVMVLAESTARQLWPGEDPIGHRVSIGDPKTDPWRTVVGIVGDVRHFSLDEAPTLQMYLPQSQVTDSFLVLTVRTPLEPQALMPALRGVLRELDPSVPVYDVATLREVVDRSVAQRRFVMQLLGTFALLALLLATIGLYGVVSYMVAQRTREVGLRVALGAAPGQILGLILGSGIKTVAIGLAVGLAATLVAARFLGTLLFDVEPHDPVTLGAAGGILMLVALLAHFVPAVRALRIDPSIALRQE
jgi:putative ABC transport system permease protein